MEGSKVIFSPASYSSIRTNCLFNATPALEAPSSTGGVTRLSQQDVSQYENDRGADPSERDRREGEPTLDKCHRGFVKFHFLLFADAWGRRGGDSESHRLVKVLT